MLGQISCQNYHNPNNRYKRNIINTIYLCSDFYKIEYNYVLMTIIVMVKFTQSPTGLQEHCILFTDSQCTYSAWQLIQYEKNITIQSEQS